MPTFAPPLKVAFLVGGDTRPVRDAIDAVCRLSNIEPVTILLDRGYMGWQRRIKNLRNNLRRDGLEYPLTRLMRLARQATDLLVSRTMVRRSEVLDLLHKAFPERSFSLPELAARHGMKLSEVLTLNSPEAARLLAESGAELGIVLGTRILRKDIFSVPKLGCINVHKGRVPEYRGLPPGFWELYDGVQSAGVTIHFVSSGLDKGDVIAASEVAIHRFDTPDTLLERLHIEGQRILVQAVDSIQRSSYSRTSQPESDHKARTTPGLAHIRDLRRRLPHWKVRGEPALVVKNLYSLAIYWSGLYALVRAWHSFRGNRAAILLHHRVNDYAGDVLTTDTETFAAQLLAIRARYQTIETDDLVAALSSKRPFPATGIAIHFDDCYRDVYTNGAPILEAAGFPATLFVSSGYLDSDLQFIHDQDRYPFFFENLLSDDLRDWVRRGFGVGAHTITHVDLGKCELDQARTEIIESGRRLAQVLDRPIPLFSFPFGAIHNIRRETADIVIQSEYKALFSAHGGFVDGSTGLSDIPRIGCNGDAQPLYLMLEIEGLSPSQMAARLKRVLRKVFRRGDARGH